MTGITRLKQFFNRPHFTQAEEALILAAIVSAEEKTSGEIRVHLTLKKWEWGNTYRRACRLFKRLGMEKTKERNGILFFIAIHKHAFAIVGDQGIHEKVTQAFWDELRDRLTLHIKQGHLVEGLIDAITRCGESLAHFFPRQEDDRNELSNTISVSRF